MYKERVIEMSGLNGKTHFTISSDNGEVDFKLKTTLVKIYFDDVHRNKDVFFAELKVHANNQEDTRLIDVEIPKGANHATIILATNFKDYDLDKITTMA